MIFQQNRKQLIAIGAILAVGLVLFLAEKFFGHKRPPAERGDAGAASSTANKEL